MADDMDRLLMVSGTLDTTGIGASPLEKLQNVSYAFGAPAEPQPVVLPSGREVPAEEVRTVQLTGDGGSVIEALAVTPTPEELAAAVPAFPEPESKPQEPEPVKAPVKRTRKTAAAKAAEAKEQADAPAES